MTTPPIATRPQHQLRRNLFGPAQALSRLDDIRLAGVMIREDDQGCGASAFLRCGGTATRRVRSGRGGRLLMNEIVSVRICPLGRSERWGIHFQFKNGRANIEDVGSLETAIDIAARLRRPPTLRVIEGGRVATPDLAPVVKKGCRSL
jgi:hypothetical protein